MAHQAFSGNFCHLAEKLHFTYMHEIIMLSCILMVSIITEEGTNKKVVCFSPKRSESQSS